MECLLLCCNNYGMFNKLIVVTITVCFSRHYSNNIKGLFTTLTIQECNISFAAVIRILVDCFFTGI